MIYNCVNKFSILGASFKGIVKNARVLSHRSDISICWNSFQLPPEIHVDHVHYTCKHSCVMLFVPPPPPCTLDQEMTKILTFPSAKWDICPALRGHFKRRTPGNGLRPSTRAQEYLCFDGLKAWHIQSTADTDNLESLYATAITGPMRPWLLYSNTD